MSGQLVFNHENQSYELLSEDFGSFKIDFSEREYKRAHRGAQELIAKACGLKKDIETVLDLTAGLGEDSVFLARLGFQVHGVERNPLIFALLIQAWKAAPPDFPRDRLSFYYGSALDVVPQMKSDPLTTAVYFDPMFPEKKKSALPRKEMQIFKTVVGEDPDAAPNLEHLLNLNFKRVVVKRPLRAEVLLRKPDHQFLGKTIRYDVYMARR